MKKHKIPILIIVLGIFISVVHSVSLLNSLYFLFWWLDIIMHFLAGVLISLSVMWIYQKHTNNYVRPSFDHVILLNIFLFALTIGLVWESFELLLGVFFVENSTYVKDTILDFIMNSLGVVVGYIYFLNVKSEKYDK